MKLFGTNGAPEAPPQFSEDKSQKKWEEFGFSSQIAKEHPDFVTFLFTSGIIFSIVMFRNSFGDQGLDVDSYGHPLLKVDGVWTRWDAIKDKIEYDPKREAVIAIADRSRMYNYIMPQGLVQKHNARYDELYSVAKVTSEQKEEIQKEAEKFWQANDEVDPGKTKDCVLQVVTTRRDLFKRSWWTENLLDNTPEHVSMRLIDKEGNLYSFGMKMPPSEARRVFAYLPFTYLTTATANVSTPDYEEARRFDERRVTSIPLTSERKDAIIQFINEINSKDLSFNVAKQNCNKLAQIVLGIAGVEVNTRISFGSLFFRLLPSPSRLPLVGGFFSTVHKVVQAVSNFFSTLVSYVPKPIIRVFTVLTDAALFLPRLIQTVSLNILAIILGAIRSDKTQHVNEAHDDRRLVRFPSLIHSVSDFFKAEKTHSYFSGLMVEWQLKQQSTRLHKYDKVRMYL